MTGMDLSQEMLDFAQETALQEGVRGEYVLGDVTKKKLPAWFDFATAINDCINYVPKDKLETALKNVRGALKKGGVFLFDISSSRKFREKIANTVSVDDREEVTYLNFQRQEADGVTMDVTLFVKDADGKYVRMEETHRQYVYEEEEILSALEKVGFEVLEVEGHLGEEKGKSDRISFLVRKK